MPKHTVYKPRVSPKHFAAIAPRSLEADKARNLDMAKRLAAGEIDRYEVQKHTSNCSYNSVLYLARTKFGFKG